MGGNRGFDSEATRARRRLKALATHPIDHGVPVGEKINRGGGGRGKIYFPWDDMKVGDSFFVPRERYPDAPQMKGLSRITSSVANRRLRHENELHVVRWRNPEDEEKDGLRPRAGWRVWRIR